MAYRFKKGESTATGFRRIAEEQLTKAIQEIEDSSLDRHETVHQVRKRCKMLRALVRLARPCLGDVYKQENAWYRDSARELSDIRDAQALIESCDALMKHFSTTIPPATFAELRQRLIIQRDQAAAEQIDIEARLSAFLQRMREGRERVHGWPLEAEGFALVRGGLSKTYRRGRKGLQVAYREPSAAHFHEWRKRVKYHWYHCRLLRNTWPKLMSKRAKELKRLSDYLGDDHDLAVLQQTLQEEPGRFGAESMIEAFLGLLQQRQEQLRSMARPLGLRIYAEKTKRHAQRLNCYWKAWEE